MTYREWPSPGWWITKNGPEDDLTLSEIGQIQAYEKPESQKRFRWNQQPKAISSGDKLCMDKAIPEILKTVLNGVMKGFLKLKFKTFRHSTFLTFGKISICFKYCNKKHEEKIVVFWVAFPLLCQGALLWVTKWKSSPWRRKRLFVKDRH